MSSQGEIPAAAGDVYLPFASLSSRTSAPLIVLAVIHFVIGIYLVVCGRRFWRITCAICLGLAAEWAACAITMNVIGSQGFGSSISQSGGDAIAMGILLASLIIFTALSILLPSRWYVGWWPGLLALGLLAGSSLAVILLIMKDGHLLIASEARWALVGGLALVFATLPILTGYVGATVCACLIGSFCLALSTDLLLNRDTGGARGLRELLDRQDAHRTLLDQTPYDPPLSTRLLYALSWLLAIAASLFQIIIFRKIPFIHHARDRDGRDYLRSDTEKQTVLSKLLLRRRDRDPNDFATYEKHSRPHSGVLDADGHTDSDLSTPRVPLNMRSVPADEDIPSSPRSSIADSEMMSLTRNYHQALHNLERGQLARGASVLSSAAPPGRVLSPSVPGSNSVPIHLGRTESPVHMVGPSSGATTPRRPLPIPQEVLEQTTPQPHERRHFHVDLPTDSPEEVYEGEDALASMRRAPPVRPTILSSGNDPHRLSAEPQAIPRGRALERQHSEHGTTYSVPMTNVTHEEYGDRETVRPPSWTGALPWNTAMLRGDLDPRTLPQAPADQANENIATVPLQSPAFNRTDAAAMGTSHATMQPAAYESRSIGHEDVYLGAAATASDAKKLRRLSPNGSQTSLPTLPSPFNTNRAKLPKTSRSAVRSADLFPADDDLPDENSSSEGHGQGFVGGVPAGFSDSGTTQQPEQFDLTPSGHYVHPLYRAQQSGALHVNPEVHDLQAMRRPSVVHQNSLAESNVASIVPTQSSTSVYQTPYSEFGPGMSQTPTPRLIEQQEEQQVGILERAFDRNKDESVAGDTDSVHAAAMRDVAAAVEAGLVNIQPESPKLVDKVLSRTASRPVEAQGDTTPPKDKVRFLSNGGTTEEPTTSTPVASGSKRKLFSSKLGLGNKSR